MILAATERQSHCTALGCRLKRITLLLLATTAAAAATAQHERPGDAALRRELARLLETGQTERAVERVQAALRQAPEDARVRHEYVTLHLALARNWLSQQRFDDCLAAVEAILAVQADHEPARAIRRQLSAARERAAKQLPDIDQLLRLELFESALERIREVKALRPDLAPTLAGRERAAWLGAADDHFLARNFNEAFALYEHLLSLAPTAQADVRLRWSISLALALSESDFAEPFDPESAERLLARVADEPSPAQGPLVGLAIRALLAERAGRQLEAGRTYAEALGVGWQLPPADQRLIAVARLRQQVVERLRVLYDANSSRRRDGAWQIVLPGVWKHRQTQHFHVYARNDLVAERVAEAAEFHLAGLADWLGVAHPGDWEPRCELRIHATLENLHQATGTRGDTRTLTRTRFQGERVLLRRTDLWQDDRWLLGSTLPHELAHLLPADTHRDAQLPLALEEGLALQAEPPARRLQLRRLLGASPPNPADLLRATRIPVDRLTFHARCDALTSLLLQRAGLTSADRSEAAAIAGVLRTFRAGYTPQWWKAFGWETEQTLLKDWFAWHEAWRHPPRMPLMILARPAGQDRGDGG
ncbi:MAG: tetratricopeptide repeat protein [Phycisphaerae bacterium]